MKKSELLAWLQEENRRWAALLEQIGVARMEQPGADGHWSIKDLVAHLTGWQQRLNGQIQAAHRNDPEPLPPWPPHLQNDDEINDWIYASNHERTVSAVLDESRQVIQQLSAVIAALPDDVHIETVIAGGKEYYVVWLGDKRFPPGEFFYHFRDDHEPAIRTWLAQALQ